MATKRNLLSNFFGQGWVALMNLAFVPLYVRYLGVESYGLIGIFTLLQAWLFFLDLGLSPALNREMARFIGGGHTPQSIRDLLRSVEILGGAIALFVCLGIWGSSDWLAAHWLRDDKINSVVVAQSLTIMGVIAVMNFLENIYRSSLMGLQRQVFLNGLTIVLSTLQGLGAVGILIWFSPTIQAFFLWQGLLSIVSVGVLALSVYHVLPSAPARARFSPLALKNVWGFAAGTLTLTLLGFILSQADKLILSRLLSLKDFGYYALAFSLAGAIGRLSFPLHQAIFPKLTTLCQEKNEPLLALTYHKASQLTAVLIGSAGLILILFGEWVLILWTGNGELAERVYPILWILSIGMILNNLISTPYSLQMAAGWTGLGIKINSIMVIVFVPVLYFFAREFQAVGAAVTWGLVNLTYLVVIPVFMHRRLLKNAMADWYIKDLFIPLFTAAATAATLRLIFPHQPTRGPMFIYLISAAFATLAAAALAARQVRLEIRAKLTFLLG